MLATAMNSKIIGILLCHINTFMPVNLAMETPPYPQKITVISKNPAPTVTTRRLTIAL